MSKGTVRFPASAIADGCVGTARIREQIAGAAARLASDEHAALDAATSRMVAMPRGVKTDILAVARSIASGAGLSADRVALDLLQAPDYSPIERMQQLGRLGRGKQNKTETAYEEEVLKPQLHVGEILWYRFEAIKLRLADNTFITIDFPVITAAGQLEFREVKGRWTDDARAKTKVAATQFPFRFIAIHAVGRGSRRTWRVEDLTSRSW
nr:MAG TPA: Endonuclease [Caudoviricetes sp.]